MKKIIHSLVFLFTCSGLHAQQEMSEAWSTKLDHKIENNGLSDSKGFCYGSSDKEFSFVSNGDGKVVWTKRFKDIAKGINKVDEQIPMWDANVLFVFDRKMGKDKTACIDLTTGEFLWMTDKYQDLTDESIIYIPELESFAVTTKTAVTLIKARTGEEVWSTQKFKGVVGAYTYMKEGYLVMLNYKPTLLASLFSGFKNQIVKINVKNGDVVWDETYIGIVEKKAVTREPLPYIKVENGKVFLFMNGIQVYDYNTGAKQWAAAFDADQNVVSPPSHARRFGCYGVVAEPIISGNDVYVIDMLGKKKQYIKKYDLNSGKLLWTSPEIPDAKALPGMYLAGNTVVLQIGGMVECQAYTWEQKRNPDGSTEILERWMVYHRNVKPYGVQAYDATNGKQLWESERFKKGITNAFVSGNNIIVCSGKALYALDVTSGKETYEVDLKPDDVNLAQKILDYKDKVIVVGEKGVASHNKSDGKMVCSGRWKSGEFRGMYGSTLLFERDNSDIAAYDVENCKFKYYDARKGSTSKLSNDGKFVYVWEKKTISKLSTQ
ncbi:MAG: PQQ-binding-like beta-propeller repeat protein [Bacteroidetes bacterium]|nr:PQQ-binding-like beta-propeller repeat protein [Bacteroidota bacterium]